MANSCNYIRFSLWFVVFFFFLFLFSYLFYSKQIFVTVTIYDMHQNEFGCLGVYAICIVNIEHLSLQCSAMFSHLYAYNSGTEVFGYSQERKTKPKLLNHYKMNALYTSLNQAIHNVSEMANERAGELKKTDFKAHAALNKNEFKSKIACYLEICFVWMAVFHLIFFSLSNSDRKQLK